MWILQLCCAESLNVIVNVHEGQWSFALSKACGSSHVLLGVHDRNFNIVHKCLATGVHYTKMATFIPLSKHLSFVAKIWTLLSPNECPLSFGCSWMAKSWPEESVQWLFSLTNVQIYRFFSLVDNMTHINLCQWGATVSVCVARFNMDMHAVFVKNPTEYFWCSCYIVLVLFHLSGLFVSFFVDLIKAQPGKPDLSEICQCGSSSLIFLKCTICAWGFRFCITCLYRRKWWEVTGLCVYVHFNVDASGSFGVY